MRSRWGESRGVLELAIIKEAYLSVEGLLAYLDVRQTPCRKGVLIDQSSGPLSWPLGGYHTPSILVTVYLCTQVPRYPGSY